MKKIIHLTLFLAFVSALAGGILATVDAMTRPIIVERQIAAVKSSLQEIFPNATEFAELNFTDDSEKVTNVYEAQGEGYAFNVTVQGYKDVITYIVGVDMNQNIVGFVVNYVNDTPGLGSKVGDPEFAQSLVGKNLSDTFDTIAGATVSSSAALKGLDSVKTVLESLK